MMAIVLLTSESTKYFHFKTAGMGCSNSGPAWCRASDAVLRGVHEVYKRVDDCILQAQSEDTLVPKLGKFFEAARQGNMKSTFGRRGGVRGLSDLQPIRVAGPTTSAPEGDDHPGLC